MANPTIEERLYTADEFREITRLPENEHRRLELIDGVIVEMPSSSQMNTVLAARIVYFFNAFVIPRNLGYVSGADGGYRLDDRNVRQPDAAFISKTRHPKLENVEFPVAPDLAVEVISPGEDSLDIVKKVQRYIFSGTRLVWVVYPDDKTVYVWQQGQGAGLNVEAFGIDAILTGGDVLPDFTLPVKDIFPD